MSEDRTAGKAMALALAMAAGGPGVSEASAGAARGERLLSEIAAEIRRDWKRPYFGAVPYLSAMASLDRMSDSYGLDDAESIVLYFLANAQTWRGETAKRVKAELKGMLKGVRKAG